VAVSFEDKAKLGVNFFSNLFSSPPRCPIQEIMEVVGKFPTVFYEEMNLSLEEEVTEPELRETLFSMKNGKIPGPDGVTVEFFKAFYDHLKNDMLLVVRESQKEGRIHNLSMPPSYALSQKSNVIPPLKIIDRLHAAMLSTN
jgi:hypothetical protein